MPPDDLVDFVQTAGPPDGDAIPPTRAEAMPIVPASDAVGLPPWVSGAAAVWEETIAGGGYGFRRLARGTRLRLVDLAGDACVSLLVFNAEQTGERLNVADTTTVQRSAYLGQGKLLLSDMGRVMLSIVEDNAGAHDVFCGASTEASNARRYGDGANHGAHPNARDRFAIALAKLRLARRDIHPCVNLFKGVRIAEDGAAALDAGPFQPGRAISLVAEMDVIVVLANCPHVLDARPDYTVTPVRATAWRDRVTPEADPVRTATPEGLRAFLNTEDYYRR